MRRNRMSRLTQSVVTLAVTAALGAASLLPVSAAWQPSKAQKEVGAVSAELTDDSGEITALEILTEAKTDSAGDVENVETSKDVYIKVTPVSKTLSANETVDTHESTQGLAYAEKAGLSTDSGLLYSTNDSTNLVYAAVTGSTSTTQFLEKIGGDLLTLVEEAVAEIGEEGDTVDDYSPLGLFDVTASEGAIEVLGTNGSVTLELELDGVSEDSRLIGIHFFGDLGDEEREAAWDALQNDFDNAVLNYDAEIVETVPGDGVVTITLSSFSPVMILTRVEEESEEEAAETAEEEEPEDEAQETAAEEEEAADETAEEAAETAAEAETESTGGTAWIWILVIVLILVLIVVLVLKNRKKS